MTPPRKITGGFRLRLPAPEAIRYVAACGGSGSGSGVIFGALARSGRTSPGLSVRASGAYSFLQRVFLCMMVVGAESAVSADGPHDASMP